MSGTVLGAKNLMLNQTGVVKALMGLTFSWGKMDTGPRLQRTDQLNESGREVYKLSWILYIRRHIAVHNSLIYVSPGQNQMS